MEIHSIKRLHRAQQLINLIVNSYKAQNNQRQMAYVLNKYFLNFFPLGEQLCLD